MDDPTTSTDFFCHPRKDRLNFVRISGLLSWICIEIVRILFSKYIQPGNLKQTLQKSRNSLINKLNNEERNLIYPRIKEYVNPNLTTEDLDIALMIKLLQKLKLINPHNNGWGNDPQEGDTSIAACLEIIKMYRNETSHSKNGKIKPGDFKRIWGRLKTAVVEMERQLIGGTLFQNAVEYLYTCKLDDEEKDQREKKSENVSLKKNYSKNLSNSLNHSFRYIK